MTLTERYEQLTAAYTVEMNARLAVARAESGSEAHRAARVHHKTAEHLLQQYKNAARKELGWHAARTIIGDACLKAEQAVRAAAEQMPALPTQTLMAELDCGGQHGVTFMDRLDGLVRVEQWERTDTHEHSCVHLLSRSEAREYWRNALAEGLRRTA